MKSQAFFSSLLFDLSKKQENKGVDASNPYTFFQKKEVPLE